MSLEEKLINDIESCNEVPLERALLVLSGLQTEEEIKGYIEKINKIHDGFKEYKNTVSTGNLSQTETAKLLHKYFWENNPNRYNGNFLLAQVIDAELKKDKNQGVGNCLGLSSLYSIIGLREGLNLSILVEPKHIKSRLRDGDKNINIEHTNPFGFDCRGGEVMEFPVSHIISIIYSNRGYAKSELRDLKGAIKDYDMALKLNPNDSTIYYNRGFAKFELRDLKGAIKDCEMVLKLNLNDSKILSRVLSHQAKMIILFSLKDCTKFIF